MKLDLEDQNWILCFSFSLYLQQESKALTTNREIDEIEAKMQVSGAISDVLVALPPSGGIRFPEFRHLHTFSDAKSFLSAGILKVIFLSSFLLYSLPACS